MAMQNHDFLFEGLKLLTAAFLGFLANFLLQKRIQKRVKLQHSIGKATRFAEIPPAICFQELKIMNSGNAPATNVTVTFKKSTFDQGGVLFRVRNDEKCNDSTWGENRILNFERILPNEILEITFKSPNALPSDFLVGIKSDQVISEPEKPGTEPSWQDVITISVSVGMIVSSLWIATSSYFSRNEKLPRPSHPQEVQKPVYFAISTSTDKREYRPGETVVVSCVARNISSETIKEAEGRLYARGFSIDFEQQVRDIPFFEMGRDYSWQVKIPLPKNSPAGTHAFSLKMNGYWGSELVFGEGKGEFIILK